MNALTNRLSNPTRDWSIVLSHAQNTKFLISSTKGGFVRFSLSTFILKPFPFLSFSYSQSGGFKVLIPLVLMISLTHGRHPAEFRTNREDEVAADDNFLSRFRDQRPQKRDLPVFSSSCLEDIEKYKRLLASCKAQALTAAIEQFSNDADKRKICNSGGLCCNPKNIFSNGKCGKCGICSGKKF